MKFSGGFIDLIGLMALFVVLTIIFVRFLSFLSGKRHNFFRVGIEFLVLFTLSFFFSGAFLERIHLAQATSQLENISALFWCLSLAFLINACLRQYVWQGTLSHNGVCKVPRIFTDAVALLIYGLAIMLVLHYVYGKPVTSIVATSGALAFVVGLSAQSTLKEVFAGMALNATKALRIGDYVEIDGIYGSIYDINWRSVSVHNPHMGSLYIFPNSKLAEGTILNYCEPTGLFKYTITFVVEMSASPDLVTSTLLDALKGAQYIRRDPEPDINILGFTDLGMKYRLRYYFDGDDAWWPAQNEACAIIWASMQRRGIRIAIDRHKLQTGDEFKRPSCVRPADVGLEEEPLKFPLSQIRCHPLFKNLDEKRLSPLGEAARRLEITAPGVVLSEGAGEPNVFFLESGCLAVQKRGDTPAEFLNVAKIEPGNLAGLEVLFKQDAASWDVLAETFSIVWALPVEQVEELLDKEEVASWCEKEQARFAEGVEAARMERELANHSRKKDALKRHLRGAVHQVMDQAGAGKVMSVFTRWKEKERLAQAVLAGCAYVESTRFNMGKRDQDDALEVLTHLEFFKHSRRAHITKIYRGNLALMEKSPEKGKAEIQEKVISYKGCTGPASLIIGVAHAIARGHEDTKDLELAAIKEISEWLDVSSEIDEHLPRS